MANGRAPKDFIPDFSSDVGADFQLWLEDVNGYLSICGVIGQAEKKTLFLNLAGLAIRKVVKGLVIPTPATNADGSPGDSYQALTEAVLAHFRPSVNTTSERHKFRQLKQLPDEHVSSFVGRLCKKVELCNFVSTDVDSVINTQVRDQLIIGLSTPELRRELLKESKLSLADAVSKAVALETSFVDCKLYHETPVPRLSSVAAVTDRSEKWNT